MEATLKRLKEQRKSLKSKITRTANALKQAVTDKCHAEAKSLHQSLVDLFRSQYMNLHYDYVEALEDSVDCSFDLEPYKVVNGMSCDQHLEAVSQVFSDASDSYVNFCKLSERAELSALVDLPLQLADQTINELHEFLGNDKSVLSSDDILSKAQYSIDDLKSHYERCRTVSGKNDQCGDILSRLSKTILELSQNMTQVTGLAKSKQTASYHQSSVFSVANGHVSRSQSPLSHTHSTPTPASSDSDPQLQTQGTFTGSELQGGVISAQSNLTNRSTMSSSRYKRPDPPKFSGTRREWPEFKAVWQNYASTYYDNDLERSHALKEALSGSPMYHVRPIYSSNPGAYSEIWGRLLEIYDDVSLSVQSVFNDLKRLKPVKEGDPNGLVRLVNDIEMGYSQLKQIGNLECVTMIQVDEVCECLPPNIRDLWEEKYHSLSSSEKLHPFKAFMDFISIKRSVSLRRAEKPYTKPKSDSHGNNNQSDNKSKNARTFHSSVDSASSEQKKAERPDIKCVIHATEGSECKHSTEQCTDFGKLSLEDKREALKKYYACFRCFRTVHNRKWCKEKAPCKHCNKTNHHSLLCMKHFSQSSTALSIKSHYSNSSNCVLPIVNTRASKDQIITAFFDGGSDATYITHAAANQLGAKCRHPVTLDILGIGKTSTRSESYIYEFELYTPDNVCKTIYAYGMDTITGPVSALDYDVIKELFPLISVDSIRRGPTVDVLIGADYYGYHPKHEVAKAGEHLSVMQGILGTCLVGSHPKLRDDTSYSSEMKQVLAHCCISLPKPSRVCDTGLCLNSDQSLTTFLCSAKTVVNDFILGENLGVEVSPKCGSCKCGKCPILGYTYSFEEEQQLQMIRENLNYDSERKIWTTSYPWIRDPSDLPDNYSAALATLRNTEKTLGKDAQWAKTYHDQIMDMVQRGVARKLEPAEINQWEGPRFYISHLAVLNPKSKTTPVRIVFNSSQNYQGKSLNSFLAKGPDAYVNNLTGILLRWRENSQVLVGDIRKMYNSVYINDVEQHCHRFLWRNLDDTRPPDVYIIQRVNMGDKPAGAIASEALYKTAHMFQSDYPQVADLLTQSTYVDDIIESVDSLDEAVKLATDTSKVLGEAGFRVKSWLFSGESAPRVDPNVKTTSVDESDSECSRVLGVVWNSKADVITFVPSLNFSVKRKGVYTRDNLHESEVPAAIPLQLTRRMVLEQTMKVFDPYGFLSPFTLLAKMLLRETWKAKLQWDEAIPELLRKQWVHFFENLFQVSKLQFDRCMKPSNAVGSPILVILSDGSDIAYGCVAFIRWNCVDGSVWCRQIMSKSRIAPVNKISTPQMELNGAVVSKRIRAVIENECRFQFERVLQLVDSETVLSMISKCSTRFRIYEGVRVGEVQAATRGDLSCWKWISGEKNTSDWLTRGRTPCELSSSSEWWTGPKFMYDPIECWPVKSVDELSNTLSIPGLKKVVNISESAVHTPLLDYAQFSSSRSIHWAVCRALAIVRSKSFRGGVIVPSSKAYEEARICVIRDVQVFMKAELLKGQKGQYNQLNPQLNSDDVWVVGSRLSHGNPLSPEGKPQALLPSRHAYTRVVMMDAHVAGGHRGRDATLARFRQSYWTPQGSKIAQAVCKQCQHCKLIKPKLMKYSMAQLPEARLKASPPFTQVMLDLFGPYTVKGEVQRRTSGKAYGVLFTDLYSRAVHVEVVPGYDAESFKDALIRYSSVRGWPTKIYSDPGSQLVCVEKDLKVAWKSMVKNSVYKLSSEMGTEWIFGPASSPWYQGAIESMIKNIKLAIKYAMGNQRLRYSEFETVCKYAANQVNERPLGTLSTSDSEISILTPNSLLLGRALSINPGYSFVYESLSDRRHVLGTVANEFWKRWCQFYVPTMFSNPRNSKNPQNLKVGDVVVVTETNPLKQGYFIARVQAVYPSRDGVVRKVALVYKNIRVGSKVYEYRGSPDVLITRSVKNLALLVSVDDQ